MLKVIFWILVGVIALSFFGISLQSVISSPTGQENFAYLWYLIKLMYMWVVSFFINIF